MVPSSTPEPCPRCGQPVSAGWLGGLCPRCLSRTSLSTLIAGSPVRPRLGDYELGEELGRGAMGAVYRARHTTLGQEVALKVILAGEFASEAERRRFLAEAGQAARLEHPGIIRVLNYGEAGGRQFYAMELVNGPTLAQAAKADFAETSRPVAAPVAAGLRDDRAVATLLAAVARAVQHAHERGVLHRDLKPGNILLDAAGQPHVGDFGLAKLLGDEAAAAGTMTLAGSPVGTPAYMAPEQVRGERVLTTAADVWSLGAILFELLAGRPAFAAASPAETYRRILEDEPEPVTACRRDLEVIARKCLRKDPAQRYASAAALADDLDRWLRGEPIQARPVSGAEQVWLWSRRRPVVAVLAAALGLLVLVVAVGAPVAAMRLAEARRKESAARAEAQEKLFEALLAQARASRLTLEPGRRAAGLNAVRAAAQLKITPELRDEATALLAVTDREEPAGFTNFIYRGLAPAMDPGFRRFARMEEDFSLRIRDRADGQESFRWAAPDTNVAVAAIHFDAGQSHLLVTYGDRHVQAVRRSDRAVLLDARNVWSGGFSPDGRRFALGQGDRTMCVHRTSDGSELARRQFDRNVRVQVAFHPGGLPVLAVPVGNQLLLWHWDNNTIVETFTEEAEVRSAAWHGDWLARSMVNGQVRLLNVRSRRSQLLSGHRDSVDVLRFSPEGRMLASKFGYDGIAHLWDVASGTVLLRESRFHLAQFRDDGGELLLNDTIRWGLAPLTRPRSYHADYAPTFLAKSFTPDGRWLLCGGDALEIREARTGRRLLRQPLNDCRGAFVLPGGRALLAGERTRILRWDLERQGEHLALLNERVLHTPGFHIEAAAVSPDGHWLAVAGDDVVDLVELNGSGPVRRLSGSIPRSPTFSPDGRWLVAGTFHGRGLQIWDLTTNREPAYLNTGNVFTRFSPDGQRLLAATSAGLAVLETGSWKVLFKQTSELGSDLPGLAAWSPNGRLIAFMRGRSDIVLLDGLTGERRLQLTSPTPLRLQELVFDPAGEWLVASSDCRLERWHLAGLRGELADLGIPWNLPAGGIEPQPVRPDLESVVPLAEEAAVPRGVRPARVYPLRPAGLPATQLDLTAHYNARLDEDWHLTGNPKNSFARLPTNFVSAAGTPFDARGLIQLAGRGLASDRSGYPLSVTNIAVGQKCQALHFLSAAGYQGNDTEGAVVAQFRVHYADGATAELPLRLGPDTADWFQAVNPPSLKVSAPVAWTGSNPDGQPIQLFEQTWNNPRPEVVIQSVGFLSANRSTAPFLLGITAKPQ